MVFASAFTHARNDILLVKRPIISVQLIISVILRNIICWSWRRTESGQYVYGPWKSDADYNFSY